MIKKTVPFNDCIEDREKRPSVLEFREACVDGCSSEWKASEVRFPVSY